MAKKTSKKKTHQDRHTHTHKQLPNAHVYKFLCSFSCFLLASFVASAPLALAIQFSYNFLTIFVAAHVTNTRTLSL